MNNKYDEKYDNNRISDETIDKLRENYKEDVNLVDNALKNISIEDLQNENNRCILADRLKITRENSGRGVGYKVLSEIKGKNC